LKELPKHKSIPNKRVNKRLTSPGEPQTFLTENFFEQLLESLEDYVIFTIDTNRRITSWNAGAEKVFQYQEGEILGKSSDIFFIPEDRKKGDHENEVKIALTKGRAKNERWHVRKDKSRFWGYGLVFPLKDKEGKHIGFTKIMRDLTERKKFDTALAESEQRFRALIENSSDIIAISSANADTLYVSPAVTRVLGYSQKEFKEKGISVIHPDDLPIISGGYTQILTKAGSSIVVQYRIKHKNGSWRWFEGTGRNLLDDPNVKGIVSNFRDITERKESQEKAALLAQIVQSSDDAIISRTLDGKVLSWNKGAETMYGYSAEEMIGKSVSCLIPEDKKSELKILSDRILKGEHINHFETVRCDRNNRSFDVSLTLSPLMDKDGTIVGISAIARDITEKKQLERQRNDFIGIASHELKTPVTSIKAYAQVLEKRFSTAGDEYAAQQLAKMNGQLDKLAALISDLLDVTKIESGKIQFDRVSFDLGDLVRDIIDEMQHTSTSHEIVLKKMKRTLVIADKDRVGQVLSNFLSNAIKYSPHASKVIVTVESTNKEATVCVQDFGVGIPKAKQGRVFDRFFRVSGPKQETYPGLGLGLFISKEIIERQGGKIWVNSKKGEGATFCFSLKLSTKSNK
jgi:PAS domain S-box-containing protein